MRMFINKECVLKIKNYIYFINQFGIVHLKVSIICLLPTSMLRVF